MWRWLAGGLGAALLVGCSPGVPPGGGPVPARAAQTQPSPAAVPAATPMPSPVVFRDTVIVEAAEQYFYPEQLTITRGTTVRWLDIQGTHDMVADNKAFASAVLVEGGTYSFTFTTPGVYRYICTLHYGAGMWAEIIVE